MLMTEASASVRKTFYVPAGDGFRPTALTMSPWRSDAQNGVSLGMLMVHTLETRADTGGGRLARFSLEIMRPAPRTLTHVAWRVARSGRRVRLLEGVLSADGIEAARVNALIVSPTGEAPPPMPLAPPGLPPEGSSTPSLMPFKSGLDMRLKRGALTETGQRLRQRMWMRLLADIVPGVAPSPHAVALAVSDTGGACMNDYAKDWTWPNLDIAVHFSRTPRGEWVHASSDALVLGAGVATIDHHLSDIDGPFARAHQTLLFAPRRGAAA
jgi:hypothetical protein